VNFCEIRTAFAFLRAVSQGKPGCVHTKKRKGKSFLFKKRGITMKQTAYLLGILAFALANHACFSVPRTMQSFAKAGASLKKQAVIDDNFEEVGASVATPLPMSQFYEKTLASISQITLKMTSKSLERDIPRINKLFRRLAREEDARDLSAQGFHFFKSQFKKSEERYEITLQADPVRTMIRLLNVITMVRAHLNLAITNEDNM
jgi:hypothetical protein